MRALFFSEYVEVFSVHWKFKKSLKMVRLDLAFILCCCRACLGGGSRDEEESFYDLLGLERDASSEEIKRAYKRRSLDLHPDKIAQRGKVVTEADQARFTRMKEAYEVLSDKHKRESYDAIGEKGMKWIEEPFSMDPQEMATNFANSSTLDRSKIFAIFLGIAIAVFLFPVLLCLQVDGTFGQNSSWAAVATPLWIWNAFILFYHVRIIMMGPIERPDHIPEEEWFDPLPMSKRFIGLARFLLYFLFQILAILNLDQVISLKWYIVFIPVLVVELITLSKRMSQAKQQVVTIEELEALSGRQFADFTEEEKEAISFSYLIFPSKSEGYALAKSMQESAKTDIIKICFRIAFIALLMVQLDTGVDWSWWLVFTPFFAMSCCICCTQCQKYTDLQAKAAEKLDAAIATNAENYGAMEEGVNAAAQDSESLSEEEKNEIKTQLVKTLSTCCSQTIFLVLICLCLGKLQGAGFSSLWIISPFLFLVSLLPLQFGQ